MIAPALALVLFGLVVVVAVALFWPPNGLWWRWRRGLLASERVLLEDALKHLHDCEYSDRLATVNSVAGAVGQPGNRAAELLSRLQREGLAEVSEGGWKMTSAGRSYALRIVRSHRLWEHYFSEETGLHPEEWHAEAEFREHRTSADEVEALAASMGHPRFDPHGDPIPTATGAVPPPSGCPLTQLAPGEVAEIVHVEDEPAAVYSQLVAEGLHPGMRVRMLEATPERIRFEGATQEHVLAPVVAANLAVKTRPRAEMSGPFLHLSALDPGERGRVVGLSPVLRGAERRRMLDLGLVPGTIVTTERPGPGGDPTAYRIRGALIALRREQAAKIRVEPVATGEHR